jgi:capsid protein
VGTGDLENVNLSSIRQGVLDEREGYKEKQEWMREHLCERIFDVVFPRLLLASLVTDDNGVALPASKLQAYCVGRWQPRRWQWIDPAKEVAAAESWKNNLLTSPSQLIREQGRDPEQVFQEFGQDVKAMRAAGIPDGIIASALGQKVQPTTPPINDGDGSAASNPDEGNSKQ